MMALRLDRNWVEVGIVLLVASFLAGAVVFGYAVYACALIAAPCVLIIGCKKPTQTVVINMIVFSLFAYFAVIPGLEGVTFAKEGALLWLWISCLINRGRSTAEIRSFAYALMLFAGWTLIGVLRAPDLASATAEYRFLVFFPSLVVCLHVLPFSARTALRALLYVGTLVIAYGIVTFFLGPRADPRWALNPVLMDILTWRSGIGRGIMSTVGNRMNFGAYASVIAILSIAIGRDLVGRRAWMISLLATTGVLLSLSRTGYVSFVVGVAYIGWATRRITWPAFVAAALGLLVLVVPSSVSDMLWTAVTAADFRQLSGRWDVWTVVLSYLHTATDFVVGIGNGRFFSTGLDQTAVTLGAVDNTYLKVLVENGTTGLILLCVLFIALMRTFRGAEPSVRIAAMAVWLSIFTSMLTLDMFHAIPIMGIVWMLSGILSKPDLSLREEPVQCAAGVGG